jgi:hypothetical protein
MDASNHCVTTLLSDVFVVMSNGYTECAELITSTLFAKYGLYNIQKSKAHNLTIHNFTNVTLNLQRSYIWSDMHQVSDLLRSTFLYRRTYESSQFIIIINDENFNHMVKSFKQSITDYIVKHSAFLSYCDMEHVGLFMYTNSKQGLNKDIFLQCYNQANDDLMALYKQYQGKIPKVVLSILEYIRTIIDVREINGEEMIMLPNQDNIPKLPKLDVNELRSTIHNIGRVNLKTLHKSMETIYIQYAHMNAISSFQWLIKIQGVNPCTNTLQPIDQYLSDDRLTLIKEFQKTVAQQSTPCMLQDILKLPFIKKALSVVNDNTLLSDYTLETLGYTAELLVGNVTRLYLKNIKMIVFADILFLGYYDVLHSSLMPNYRDVHALIRKAERDLEALEQTMLSTTMRSIMYPSLRSFNTSLKKLKRFHKWLVSIQTDDDEGVADALALLFGDSRDQDGHASICPICFEDASEQRDTWWKLAPCGHTLHLECFNALCKTKHSKCRLCRVDIMM